MSEMITTVTERGQASIPAEIRKKLHLSPGQRLRWQQISDSEMRIEILDHKQPKGLAAMVGYARQFNPDDTRGTDEIMAELRAGDEW